MQEKVAKRMNQLISESLWYDERAVVDHRPFRGSDNRADMACFTTDFRKNLCAAFRVRRVGQILVSRRNFRSTDESGEGTHVGAVVFRIGKGIIIVHSISDGCVLERFQGTGDTHFVQVSICGKRFQTRMRFFQPKRPTRRAPFASRTGTRMTSPRMPGGWPCEIEIKVASSMASMNPSPRVFSEIRRDRTS